MTEPASPSGAPGRTLTQPQLSRLNEVSLTVAVTFLLLIPCVWQNHIQAGDLSSHLYNAWLAGKIKEGATSGLAIVAMPSNVLSDWLLESWLPVLGVAGTEKLITGAAVLLFFWGAFSLVSVATGRKPWLLAPCLAMLSYGLIFHLGFLNFYISTGLCLWMLVLLWKPSSWRAWLSLPLAILAMLAHVVPLVWAISVVLYLQLSRRLPPRGRPLLLLGGIAGLWLLQTALMSRFPYRWSWDQWASLNGLAGITGVEQVWLFGPKYLMVAAGLFLIWCVLLLERLDQGGMLADPVVQLWLLHATAYVLIPSAIQFPQNQHVLAYIPQRISLFGALFLCTMAGAGRHGRGMTRLLALVATVFFTCLYLDDRAYNFAEDQVAALVEKVPPGSRVVAAIGDAGSRLDALAHVVDRACIGRCYSYGNYEPATAQFRIRVLASNPVVASSMTTVKEIEEGRHIVSADEAPLYSVCLCNSNGRFCLRSLSAGERTCGFSLPLSPRFLSRGRSGSGVELARQDQTEVPDHQGRVPIVDQINHVETLAPDAKAPEQERD